MVRGFEREFCPLFHHAVEVIGRRWTGVVLRIMLQGATRFGDIAAGVPNLSDKMLAERLKELEAEGIVTRTVVPETPVRVEYQLTDKGRSLEGVLEALDTWADRWVPPCPEEARAGKRVNSDARSKASSRGAKGRRKARTSPGGRSKAG
jgi:DNA-binding HxlR family transcriptional regulator